MLRPAHPLTRVRVWLVLFIVGLVLSGVTAFPFMAYGTDWLAFAHLVIAVAFWGPLRGIPWWWQIIDMSFGVVGIIPLFFAYRAVRALAAAVPAPQPTLP